jgi:hypothetical protein
MKHDAAVLFVSCDNVEERRRFVEKVFLQSGRTAMLRAKMWKENRGKDSHHVKSFHCYAVTSVFADCPAVANSESKLLRP